MAARSLSEHLGEKAVLIATAIRIAILITIKTSKAYVLSTFVLSACIRSSKF